MKASGIGGQAVMEGVMMRNGNNYAVAVRKPNHEIEIKKDIYKSANSKSGFFRLPIIRGVVAFVDSLVLGMSSLTYSSEVIEEDDEDYEPGRFERFLIKIFKEKAADVVMSMVVMISILFAIALFVLFPTFIAGLLGGIIKGEVKKTLIEGVIRLSLFLFYVWVISLMKDIKRTYMYHGAEHKCINCIENGKKLTVENVRESSRFHKRCGTSFLFIVMFISILMFMFIRTDVFWMKVLFRLLLIPVIAGISFEFIRLAGSKESKILDILSAPGMWLQRITTREPDDDMIEVAMASVEAVFDWESFVAKVRREEAGKSDKDFDMEAEFLDDENDNSETETFEENIDDVEESGEFELSFDDNEDERIHDQDDEEDIEEPEYENTMPQEKQQQVVYELPSDEELLYESESLEEETLDEYQLEEEDVLEDSYKTDESVTGNTHKENVERREKSGKKSNSIDAAMAWIEALENEEELEDDEVADDDYDTEPEAGEGKVKGGFISAYTKKRDRKYEEKRRRDKENASRRLASHRTISDYDEDYDESDELLKELDRIFEEKNKKENEGS